MKKAIYSIAYHLLLLLSNRSPMKPVNRLKIMVGGTLLFLTNQVYSQEKQSASSSQIGTSMDNSRDTIPDHIFCYVREEMPEFPGGSTALMSFISSNYELPEKITKEDAEKYRRILVTFIVNEEGDIVEPEILRGTIPVLDSAAIAVIRKMPRWKPGMFDGKNVSIKYTVPVNIRYDK